MLKGELYFNSTLRIFWCVKSSYFCVVFYLFKKGVGQMSFPLSTWSWSEDHNLASTFYSFYFITISELYFSFDHGYIDFIFILLCSWKMLSLSYITFHTWLFCFIKTANAFWNDSHVSLPLSIKCCKIDWRMGPCIDLLPLQAVLQRSYGNIKLSISKVVLRQMTFLLQIGATKCHVLKQGMLRSGHWVQGWF